MKRPPSTSSLLLVEDTDHKSVVAGIASSHDVDLSIRADGSRPVWIEAKGSAAQVLDHDVLDVELRAAALRVIGVVVDADEVLDARWTSIRGFCKTRFPGVPENLPPEGLIVQRADGLRFGAWIMPDNRSSGMVETFCGGLIDSQTELWRHAVTSAIKSRQYGADWKDVHRDRAQLYTWLAWRDIPGNQMGTAILRGVLSRDAGTIPQFLGWFRALFRI
jgi:hypothetical protein